MKNLFSHLKLKQNIAWITVVVSISAGFTACSNYVQGIQQPIDRIPAANLNSEAQVEFVIRGVQANFAETFMDLSMYSSVISDELLFDQRTGGAGDPFPIWDLAVNSLRTSGRSTNTAIAHGRLRLEADLLAERASGGIQFTSDSLRRRALFFGNFYGGVARYLYAAYWGLNKNMGGHPINGGAFIPSAAMYDSALVKLQAAVQAAPTPYLGRVAQTHIARIQLFQGRLNEARTAAEAGMRSGDAPFQALYSLQMVNRWWQEGGLGRVSAHSNRRFDTLYLRQDPTDTARIRVRGPITRSGFTFFTQNKYTTQESPINYLTWQESELILAEVAIRQNNNQNTPDALTRINRVRQSYPRNTALPATTVANLDLIYIERDKEFCFTGMRIIDQRRFDRWHLTGSTWRFLFIVQREIEGNPQLQQMIVDP